VSGRAIPRRTRPFLLVGRRGGGTYLAASRRSVARALAGTALIAALSTAAPLPARADDTRACDMAGQQAETALHLPTGLLRAIGRVESGRRDPISGSFGPWPWTINANGQGRFFADAAAAAAAVRALQAAGTTSVDVGCFQVNLMHHPLAFRRVEDSFDPAANAAYAGAFLQSLRQRLGSWEAAVAGYHSATAERGEAYRTRVFAVWNPGAALLPATPPPAPARRVGAVVIRIAGPDLAGPDAVIRVWTPARAGTAPALVVMPPPAPPQSALPIAALMPAARIVTADEAVQDTR